MSPVVTVSIAAAKLPRMVERPLTSSSGTILFSSLSPPSLLFPLFEFISRC